MSSEGDAIPHPENTDMERFFLFQKGVSIDAVNPLYWHPMHQVLPEKSGEFIIYDMSQQYVSPDVHRFVNVVPPDYKTELPTVPNGCTKSDIYRNIYTGEVRGFTLTLRPQYEETQSDRMIHLASMIVNKTNTNLTEEELMEALTPECEVDSETGIRVSDSGVFAFGIGPGYGDTGIGVSEEFLAQIEVGESSLESRGDSFFQAKYTILKDTLPITTDVSTEFVVEGGVRIHLDSFSSVRRVYNRLLTANPDSPDPLYRIIEPFFSISSKQVKNMPSD